MVIPPCGSRLPRLEWNLERRVSAVRPNGGRTLQSGGVQKALRGEVLGGLAYSRSTDWVQLEFGAAKAGGCITRDGPGGRSWAQTVTHRGRLPNNADSILQAVVGGTSRWIAERGAGGQGAQLRHLCWRSGDWFQVTLGGTAGWKKNSSERGEGYRADGSGCPMGVKGERRNPLQGPLGAG